MNPEDARSLKIEEGEMVQVSTSKGRSLRMKVKYSSRPYLGVITIPYPCPLVEEGGISSVNIERLK
jgi:anaerobic selenocysteine-containing dehydrogenase